MEIETNINVLVLGKNLVPGLSDKFNVHYLVSDYIEFNSSLDGKEFRIIINTFQMKTKNQYIIETKFESNYDIYIFVFDLNSQKQIKQLISFGYNEIGNLEEFIEKKCKNSSKVFIGLKKNYWEGVEKEEDVKDIARRHNGIYLEMYSQDCIPVVEIIKNYLMQKYKKTADEITGEFTNLQYNDNEIKIKFYSVGKDKNTGCNSSCIQKIKNCSIY